MVRGSVTLPHGTGKTVRVLVLCTPDKEEEAKAAGADEDIVISIIMKQKDAIISKAVEVTKARNSN